MLMYKNRIYIFGGNLVDTTGLPLWCFDLLTSEWLCVCSRGPVYSIVNSKKIHSQVPSNLTHHSGLLYNQSIFIFGGYRHVYGVSGELWKYDIETNMWELLYQPKRNHKGPKAMFGHRTVLYDDAMFVIFGRKRENELNNDMWKYSFESCSWTCEKQHGQLPPNLTGAAVEVVRKQMFVVGGKTEDASFNKSIYLFSFEKHRWHKYGIESDHTALSEASLICVPLALVLQPPDKAAMEKSFCETSSEMNDFGNSSNDFGRKNVPITYSKDDDSFKRVFFTQNSMFESSKVLESFGGIHPAERLSRLSVTRTSRSITSIDDTDRFKDCHPFQYHLLSSASTIFQSWESLVSSGPNSSKVFSLNSPLESKIGNVDGHFSYDNQSFLNDSFDNPLLYKPEKVCEEKTESSKGCDDSRLASDKYEEALVLFGGLSKDYFPGQKSHIEILFCSVPSVVGNSSSGKIETYV